MSNSSLWDGGLLYAGRFDAYKMGAKKPGSRSVSLHRDTNCHPG